MTRNQQPAERGAVWLFEFCYCVYESAYGVQSVHISEESAQIAMRRHRKPGPNQGARVTRMEIKSYTEKAKQT